MFAMDCTSTHLFDFGLARCSQAHDHPLDHQFYWADRLWHWK
jgi:hypothetical protein